MTKGSEGYKVRTITCEGCGQQSTRRHRPGARFCSIECYRRSPRPRRRTGALRACETCDSEFYIPASRVARGEGRFCSMRCQGVWQGRNKTEHVCKMCAKAFRWSPSRSKSGAYNITYCSLSCRDADPERRSMLMRLNQRQQRKSPTRIEVAGYSLLDALGMGYLAQASFAGKFIPDAILPDARLVIQFDGDYWHDRKGTSGEERIRRRVELDRSQDAYIRACGWEVLRLWGSDLLSSPERCAALISQAAHRPLGETPARDPLAPA